MGQLLIKVVAPKVSQIRRIALQKYNFILNYQNLFNYFSA